MFPAPEFQEAGAPGHRGQRPGSHRGREGAWEGGGVGEGRKKTEQGGCSSDVVRAVVGAWGG